MDRCALCPSRNKCLPPDGPCQQGGMLFIGEAPGINEEKHGRVFIGKTGDEVNRHYLPLAGLRRENVTFTNAIQCYPISVGGKLDPKKAGDTALLTACAEAHLYPLIEEMQPRMIVPLGAFACRAVLGDDYDLTLGHGIPVDTRWGVPAFPMQHPSRGMHEPKQMLFLRTDWDRLRRYLRGSLLLPTDTYAGFEDYAEVGDVRDLEIDPTIPLAGDTESSPSVGPYCLTYSQYPGTGRLIRAERVDLLGAFQAHLDRWESQILFHNWMYDWSVTEAMGLVFPQKRMVDTMAVVYHLGNLPQGLKALAFRELGMRMSDFDDVVTPHSAKLAYEYFELASFEDWPTPDPQMVIDADGNWKQYKPQGMNTKLKRLFTDLRKNPSIDLFERWKNWESSHAEIEAVMGQKFPSKDIAHVPFHDVLFYACRDSDALGRLWPIIRKMRTLVRRLSQERWREHSV